MQPNWNLGNIGTNGYNWAVSTYFVYILESVCNRKYYIGYTGNIQNRIKAHNTGKVKSTKSARPWKVIFTEECQTQGDAIRRESQIKSWKSRKAIENLIMALSSNG